MDGVENEERFSENLKSIQSKLKVKPLPVQFPIGAGQEFKGIVDIVGQKAYYYQPGDEKEQYEAKDVPSYLLEKTKNYRHSLLEGIGEILEKDQELVLKYLEEGELSAEEIRKLLRQATLTGKYFLVFCGSAYKHVGINLLLDGVVNYLPSPFDVKEVVAFSLQDKKKILVKYNDPLPCLALAFKIIFDDHNRRITFFRVYAGKVSIGSNIYNVSKKKEEKVSNLVRIHADKKEPINKVETGDIAAVVDLKYTVTGDTFGDRKNSLLLEAIDFAEPVISQAIEPETKKDQDKL
jgi:elongation factor G